MYSVERIESGPAHADRTSAQRFENSKEWVDAVRNQRNAYEAIDLVDEVDDKALELAKAGNAKALGEYLISRMEAVIVQRAEWWLKL